MAGFSLDAIAIFCLLVCFSKDSLGRIWVGQRLHAMEENIGSRGRTLCGHARKVDAVRTILLDIEDEYGW